MALKKVKNVNQLFKVPNTLGGRYFIELVKKFKSPCYKIRCKGRTLNEKKIKKDFLSAIPKCEHHLPERIAWVKDQVKKSKRWRNNDGSIPMSLADNIGIYFDCGNRTIGAGNSDYHQLYWDMREKVNDLERKLKLIKGIVNEEGLK